MHETGTRGLVTSRAGTFTASYDAQGKMTNESYPNGMTAYYTYNPTGTATALEYKKLTDCTEKCTWFSDSIVPSIHGETMKQASTLSEEPSDTYDGAGRLTQVQEIPTGEGCTTRLYAYEENSNRMSQTTRKPGTEGKCATEGGSSEPHIYDTGNRLDDPGVSYEAFGNITYLPATDAGGSEGSEITSEYYVDSQAYKQTQNKETSEYKLDPEDRTRETISSGKTESHVITHYDGPGSSPAWASEEAGKKWTRQIPGIGGELAAIQTSSTIELQLHDLQGNIVGTVGDSETETKLLSKYNSTEFGVPQPGTTAPKYAWLGAAGVAGEPSGVVVQDGVTYVPQIGASLQAPQDMAPGVPSNYAMPYASAISPWVAASTAATAAELTSKREQEIREREMADVPPGAIPTPEGGEGGFIEVAEGPADSGATIASMRRYKEGAGCSAVFQIKAPGEEHLVFGAEFICEQKKPHLEFEACLYEKYEDGSWKQVWCTNEGHPAFANDARGLSTGEIPGGCTDGFLCTGWVWGYIWGPGITAQTFGGLSPSETGAYVNCEGQDYDHELS